MDIYLRIGLLSEGKTDNRFLPAIILKTFEKIADEKNLTAMIEQPLIIDKKQGVSFKENVYHAAKVGMEEFGIHVLCIHSDADSKTDKKVVEEKIEPAIEYCSKSESKICRNYVKIIPVQMTEAWMLADRDLFKKQLGTSLNDNELGINKNPETFSNPKKVITMAISKVLSENTRRKRNKLSIADLYDIIGAEIKVEKLKNLPSFMKFEKNISDSIDKLLSEN